MNYSNLNKSELRKELKKLDINYTENQSKDELIRLLTLAKSSVKKVKRPAKIKNTKKYTFIFLALVLVVLMFFDQSVKKNREMMESQTQADNAPVIFEKNNQTHVVYNHPLVKLKVLTDTNCKRIECDVDSQLTKIKNSITPLFKSEVIDYNSSEGKALAEENNINLLPAFIFDQNVTKLYDFEDKKDYFIQTNENFLVYLTPFKSLKSPDLSNAQIISENKNLDAPLRITVFFSPSSPQSKDAFALIEDLREKYKNSANISLKHFKTHNSDFLASIALECYAKEDKFLEGLNKIFARQEVLMIDRDVNAKNLVNSISSSLRIKGSDFRKCFDDETVKETVMASYKEAELLGVFGVPTFFVNNNLILGSYTFEEFAEIISQIIEDEKIQLTE